MIWVLIKNHLRLKYGQFMGDEAEGAIANGGEIIEDNDHDHDQEEDPTNRIFSCSR